MPKTLKHMEDHHKRALQQPWRYTREEQERLEALAAPWPLRPILYLFWLSAAMPMRTGVPLLFTLVTVTVCLVVLLLCGFISSLAWLGAHAAWVYWLLLGATVALACRLVLRDAAATELRVRRSIAAKRDEEPER